MLGSAGRKTEVNSEGKASLYKQNISVRWGELPWEFVASCPGLRGGPLADVELECRGAKSFEDRPCHKAISIYSESSPKRF